MGSIFIESGRERVRENVLEREKEKMKTKFLTRTEKRRGRAVEFFEFFSFTF